MLLRQKIEQKWNQLFAITNLRDLVLLNFLLAFIYFLLARLGLSLATLSHSASPVWPATGFAFSIVYLFGRRVTFAVFAGAFVANFFTGGSLLSTFFISIGNTTEALVGAWIIAKILSYRSRLNLHTDAIAFTTASVVGSLFSATIGVVSLYFTGQLTEELLGPVWLTWWVGDLLGGLVVCPVLVQIRRWSLKNLVQSFKILTTLGVAAFATYIVFFTSWGGPYLFLVFPVLLYTVHIVGGFHAVYVASLVCVASVTATVNGFGPFAQGSLNERLVHLQLFLAAYSVTSLMLSGFGRKTLMRIPTLVLLLCWGLSGIVFHSFDRSEKQRTQLHLAELVRDSEEKIRHVITSYEEVLRGTASFYTASKVIDHDVYKNFQNSLEVTKNHPGLNGVGLVFPYRDNEIPKLIQRMKKEGLKDFSVRKVPQAFAEVGVEDHGHFVIQYIEPLQSNLAALGLDLASEKYRRLAAEISRDSGIATVSSKITLVQDKTKTAGILFFLPLYRTGRPTSNVDERRAAHVGWIYAPIIYNKFFNEVFSQTSNEIELQVFESEDALKTPEIVFDNFTKDFGQRQFEIEKVLQIGQKKFIFRWAKSPKFISSHNTIVAWVGFFGALASLLLTNLMIAIQSLGVRSREIAEELTRELSDSREKFQQGERRLLYALDGSNDGIWDWNIEKGEMYVSGKIAETHGWPQVFKAVSSQDLRSFAHPDDLKGINNSIKKVLSGSASTHEVETRYRTLNGDWRWVLTRGKISERDSFGVPKRMTGVHIDIHELKRTQGLLEETQNHLTNIANSVPTKVSLWNRDLKCEFANDLFSKWYGESLKNPIGKSMTEFISADEFAARQGPIKKALGGEYLQFESEVVRPSDKQKRYVITTYLPNKIKDVNEGFFLFIQDVTELKRAEILAQDDRKVAIEAANVKTQFLANMSHEIRTPLNGIIGMTNLLKNTILNSKQREYSEVISRSSDVLLNLINDILDFSKVEAGKLELEVVVFNLKDLVTDVLKSMKFSADEKNLAFKHNLHLNGQEFYSGDPGRVRQVLTNLIGNAIKFTPQGSIELRVSAKNKNEGSDIKFEIIDTGIGIPEKARDRLFQAFSQADASMSRKFGGSGLGLSICKQLVHLMGGEIGVESSGDAGSNFWFRLTLAHASRSVLQTHDDQFKPSRGTRVLIVEDNRINQQIATEILHNLGYIGQAVGNGIEAIEALRDSKFDVILMDCQMPDMDGFEAARIIRNSESINLKRIPIVAMTANAVKGDKEKCFEAGMNDYVSKPINEFELVRAIETCLQKQLRHSHILVVEDNLVNQSIIVLNLEEMGYTVSVASNGVEALQFLETQTCDLILMDCQMPAMDGFEATRCIRKLQDRAQAQLPIIALTANALKGDKEKCLESGMDDYLTKPFEVDILSKTLLHHLGAVKARPAA